MAKKRNKKKNNKKPAWKRYLSSNKSWKSKKDMKRADKAWKNSAKRQRQPAAAARHDARVQAYRDQLKTNKNSKKRNNNKRRSAPVNNKAPRDTGKYEDIRRAQAEDRKAGQKMAEQIKNMQARTGGISPEVQKQLDNLTLANNTLTNQVNTQAAAAAESAAASEANQTAWQTQLNNTVTDYQGRLDDQAQASADAMARMEQMMMQQQRQAAQAQALLQSQLLSTQNALSTQQRMSANLANAYVPQAEQSAQTVAYGDSRRRFGRRARDNSLSDLSIVSGVGGGTPSLASSALTGLQIAG